MNLMQRNLVLLGLTVGLGIPTYFTLRAEADAFVDIGDIPLLFDGFTSDNVGSIVLGQPKDEQPPAPATPANSNQPEQKRIAYDYLVLQRTDKGWRIGQVPGPVQAQQPNDLVGAPVMTSRVESDVFAHLRAIRSARETLVQPDATPEQLAEYGLDEEHAFVVRAVDTSNQHIVADLLVGRDAGQGQAGTEAVSGVFVRKADSSDVVLYELDKPWRRDVVASGWVDRTLVRLEPDKVRKLSILNASTGGKPFVFTRATGGASWQLESGPGADELGAVRQSELEGMLQRLRYLSVQSFERPLARAGDMAALGLFPPQIELRVVVDEDGSERNLELVIGNKLPDRNEHYLTCNESQFLMTWPAGMVTQFELDVRRRLFDPKGSDDK